MERADYTTGAITQAAWMGRGRARTSADNCGKIRFFSVNPRLVHNLAEIFDTKNSLQPEQILGRGCSRIPRMGTSFIRFFRENLFRGVLNRVKTEFWLE